MSEDALAKKRKELAEKLKRGEERMNVTPPLVNSLEINSSASDDIHAEKRKELAEKLRRGMHRGVIIINA